MSSVRESAGTPDPAAANEAADWASFFELLQSIGQVIVTTGAAVIAVAVAVGAVLKFYIEFCEQEEKLLERLVEQRRHKVRIRRWIAAILLWLLACFGSKPAAPEAGSPSPTGPSGSPPSGGGSDPKKGRRVTRFHPDGTIVNLTILPGGRETLAAIYHIICRLISAIGRCFSDQFGPVARAIAEPAASTPTARRRRLMPLLLVSTCLSGIAIAAPQRIGSSDALPCGDGNEPVAASSREILSLAVAGNLRVEPETVLSYTGLRVGEGYEVAQLDQALRDLAATELFADVQIAGADSGNLVIQVRENPVINRIVLEGNRTLKSEKIIPEIRLAPRQIITGSRARADVVRIVGLYRRQGRYAARVEPRIVPLDRNRVDVVFEIEEGQRLRVSRINIIGNEQFGDDRLMVAMARHEGASLAPLRGNDIYDPDRLAYDQQKLRQFYLSQGYADFRIVSAVSEPDAGGRDFIITYEVEEGERYRFGEVGVESLIPDLPSEALRSALPMARADWYDARHVEDTVNSLNELAGTFGYAFADVSPRFVRNRDERTMDVAFRVQRTPTYYVERIERAGTATAGDKVVRRAFRLDESDPFNNVRVRRSRDRIQSLGFFQDNLEIAQEKGTAPDRVVLGVEVDERATSDLQLSAGFSSIERFLVELSRRQRNFMGGGQELRAAVNYSSYSKSAELGFTEPYLFDRNIALSFGLFRRDLDRFNVFGNDRMITHQQTAGGRIRTGVPITEKLSLALRYGLSYDEVGLNPDLSFTDPDGIGPLSARCDLLGAGLYFCDAIGMDFASLGGDVRYLRTRASAARYWTALGNFIFSPQAEGGYIHGLEDGARGIEPVRLTDRFFLGNPQIRGFEIRGVGPRIQRSRFTFTGNAASSEGPAENDLHADPLNIADGAVGGRVYYLARAEVEVPLGASVRELGLRPSIFVDAGALWATRAPELAEIGSSNLTVPNQCTIDSGPAPAANACGPDAGVAAEAATDFRERFVGATPSPRLSIGFGVNWNSPFGPFRIDIARALLSEPADDIPMTGDASTKPGNSS